jgi:ribonuclease HII
MLIAGVDEVGRGSLAGPVVAAAVILDDKIDIEGIKDSKKVPSSKRKYLDKYIKKQSISWSIALASVDEINILNILQASLLAMKRAIQGLDQEPEMTLIDGIHLPELEVPSKAVIKGDSNSGK